MSYGNRWERCISAARKLIRSLGTDREVALLTSSGSVEFTTWPNRKAVLRLLDTLKPSSLAPGLMPVLNRASVLADSLEATVVAVSDRQERSLASGWQPAQDVSITLLDVGTPDFDNAGITRLTAADPFAVSGRPMRIEAEIVNHGRAPIIRNAVLSLDGRTEEAVVGIPAAGRRTIAFETTVSEAGTHLARLDLKADSLEYDNTRYLALHLARRIEVLVVQSDLVSGRYAADALSTDSVGFGIETISASELTGCDLRDYNVVVLTDAGALSRAEWTRVDFYVRSGGCALLLIGSSTESEIGQYTQSLGTVQPAGFVSISQVDTTHPVLSGIPSTTLAAARIWTHARLNAEGHRVLVRLSDGDPLIMENLSHRLMIWAIGPTPEFSDLVYKASFVPLLHRTISYLTHTSLETQYTVGDTIRFGTDQTLPMSITTPSRTIHLEPVIENGRPTVVFTETTEPGIHTAELADGSDAIVFAVNPLADEGNLRQLSEEQLESKGIEVRSEPLPESADLAVPLLYSAAAAFAAEMLVLLF